MEELHALKGAVVATWQALVLLGVREVSQVMPTHPTLVGGLSSAGRDGWMVLQAAGLRLKENAIDSTAQRILGHSARRDGMLRESSRPSMVWRRWRRLLRGWGRLRPAF